MAKVTQDSDGLTARQTKRKDWWKLRRAKSKQGQDGSIEPESTQPEAPDGSSEPGNAQPEHIEVPALAAPIMTETDDKPEKEGPRESTGRVCPTSETPGGVKGKKRKRTSVAENPAVACKVQNIEQKDTPKVSNATKRRRRMQKLKLYRSQGTVCVPAAEIADEFCGKTTDKNSNLEDTSTGNKTTHKTTEDETIEDEASEEKTIEDEASGEKTIEDETIEEKTTEDESSDDEATADVSDTTKTPPSTKSDNKNSQQLKTKKKKKKLYIAFVGNLPYDMKQEEVKFHFNKNDGVKDVRMLSVKDTSKPKGCAFVEFVDSPSLMRGIDLHHSQLGRRTINVELSARGKKKNAVGRTRARVKAYKKAPNANVSTNEKSPDP